MSKSSPKKYKKYESLSCIMLTLYRNEQFFVVKNVLKNLHVKKKASNFASLLRETPTLRVKKEIR